MLLENSDAVLLRAALAVLAECEADLLMQEDFEELLTYLKVLPRGRYCTALGGTAALRGKATVLTGREGLRAGRDASLWD